LRQYHVLYPSKHPTGAARTDIDGIEAPLW